MSGYCKRMRLMVTLFSSLLFRYCNLNERICERGKEEESKFTGEGGVRRAGREKGKEEGMNV